MWLTIEGEEMANKKPKKEDSKIVMVPVTKATRKILKVMKIDLVDDGTYEELMQRFIESEGY